MLVPVTRAPEDYAGWDFFDAVHGSVQCPLCADYIMVPADVQALLEAIDRHKRNCWNNRGRPEPLR